MFISVNNLIPLGSHVKQKWIGISTIARHPALLHYVIIRALKAVVLNNYIAIF